MVPDMFFPPFAEEMHHGGAESGLVSDEQQASWRQIGVCENLWA
jgi:hypothetical protein